MLWIKWKKINLEWRIDKMLLVFINIRFGYKEWISSDWEG